MNKRIIFISHNMQKRITYSAGLQGLGISVTEAQNLDDAREMLFSEGSPITIVIDLQSPRMRRDEVTNFLFELRDRSLPFILIGKADDHAFAERIGAQTYVYACSTHDINAVQHNLQTIADAIA